MDPRILAIMLTAALATAACSGPTTPAAEGTPEAADVAASAPERQAAPASFVNTVWAVSDSKQVEIGSLRVFLSDGTLVMASPNSKPALGSWRESGGRLSITEDGQSYDVDVLELTESSFRIRMHSPGEPVEILFKPADRAALPKAQEAPAGTAAGAALWGSRWRLEDLGGAGVVDGVEATLEFPSQGRASGSGSCNRFNGAVKVDGGRIAFSGIAATRRACPEAAMNQESAYFAALGKVARYESDGANLYLYVAETEAPLRFIRADEGRP
jgi:heat shock protein HslJ